MEYFKSKTFLTDDQEQTRILGSKLGKKITTGCCIALEGGLGAGKTTFVQGVAKGLKIDKLVSLDDSLIKSAYTASQSLR